MKNFELYNGIQIPEIGFGTWQTSDGQTAVNAVTTALKAGYRHIDAAAVYGNEKSVGLGIKESGIARNELFITSKVWNTDRGYESTLKACDKSLTDLGLEYLDLYLIHWPANEKKHSDWRTINTETWKALENLYASGKVKAIGLSNFLVNHLDALIKEAHVQPMINQIEFHPGQMQRDVVSYAKKQNILIQAWSPLGTGKMLENADLKQIAEKYRVSVAQLCIRWCLQNGVLPLPKSITPDRIVENINVYDFEITEADMDVINAMPYVGGSGLDPNDIDF